MEQGRGGGGEKKEEKEEYLQCLDGPFSTEFQFLS